MESIKHHTEWLFHERILAAANDYLLKWSAGIRHYSQCTLQWSKPFDVVKSYELIHPLIRGHTKYQRLIHIMTRSVKAVPPSYLHLPLSTARIKSTLLMQLHSLTAPCRQGICLAQTACKVQANILFAWNPPWSGGLLDPGRFSHSLSTPFPLESSRPVLCPYESALLDLDRRPLD